MRAYRICKERYVDKAFSGEGSFRYGGRCNSKGRRIVYAGGNPAIAALEVMVHLEEPSDLNRLRYVLVPVDFDERLVSRPSSLPGDWNADPPPLSAAGAGDAWVLSGSSAVLEVPSAVIQSEKNYLINVEHSDFHKIVIGKPEPFEFDSRLKKLWPPVANGIDALILVPTDPDSLQSAVTRAQTLNIPVITVDTTVKDQSYLTSHITGDNIDGGAKAASTLAEQIGGAGKVFIMSGSPSATTDTLREKGFREEMAKYPKIQIVGREYANSQPAAATSAVNTALLKFPDLAGIFAIDGTAGTGAVAALRNANKVGQVKPVGYDAYKAEVDALQEGVFTALIAQQPAKEAELALQYAVDKLTGKNLDTINKTVVIPNVVMTKDNLGETQKYMYAE